MLHSSSDGNQGAAFLSQSSAVYGGGREEMLLGLKFKRDGKNRGMQHRGTPFSFSCLKKIIAQRRWDEQIQFYSE